MFTQEEEQKLRALLGRVSKLENNHVDLSPYALLSYVENRIPMGGRAIKRTMSADLELRVSDPTLVVVDCNGGERTVSLPPASDGATWFIVVNSSS